MNAKHTTLLVALCAARWLVGPSTASGFYNPSTGRWLNRDPAQEKGGSNPLVFAGNTPIGNFDMLGLASRTCDLRRSPLTRVNARLGAQFWDNSTRRGGCRCDPTDDIEAPMTIEIVKTGSCTDDCVEQHEKQHALDRTACCRKFRKAWKAAPPANKPALLEKWRQYVKGSQNWSESRAYRVSNECLERILKDNHCDCIDEQCCRDARRDLPSGKILFRQYYFGDDPDLGNPDEEPACPF
jgi:hypothetical protein